MTQVANRDGGPPEVRATARSRFRRPERVGYAAAAALFLYGLANVYWALGGGGFPFGAEDANPEYSAFEHTPASTLAPVLAALLLPSAAVALLMALPGRRRVPRNLLLGYTWCFVAVALAAFADFRLLGNLAYALMLRFGAINWTVLNQFFLVAGAGLMAVTALAYQRRLRDACGSCGRTDGEPGWTSPEAAARWGRKAVRIAVIVPFVYASTRWAWALGIPLGISDELWEEGKEDHLWYWGAGLATLGALGALLTLGLVRRWGEVFPRWMVGLRGKRVPPLLAIVPASLVALLITIAGVMYIRLEIQGKFDNQSEDWGTTVPEMFWPLWGAALAAATLAYHLRRRGRCKRCGRL
ncbi:hypothetical protein ABVG11_21055 [Streptomyces sp. HD1123-B1]|uniref:hypothetical protein n=1 Tax=Streptomyces huangiella TaxID=3228804 RepID=UPI003D7CB0E4